MEVPETRNSLSLSLNALLASLAHVVLRELLCGLLGCLGTMHAAHVNRLSVTDGVFRCPNWFSTIRAHHASVMKLRFLPTVVLESIAIVSTLERLSAAIAELNRF